MATAHVAGRRAHLGDARPRRAVRRWVRRPAAARAARHLAGLQGPQPVGAPPRGERAELPLVLLLVFAVGTVLSVVVGVLTLGIGLLVVVPLLLVVALVGTGYQVVAAVVTSRGQDFRYPLTPQWVR
nr:DUF4870 domain-containing protein [Angustibacter aerolatus]